MKALAVIVIRYANGSFPLFALETGQSEHGPIAAMHLLGMAALETQRRLLPLSSHGAVGGCDVQQDAISI